MFNNILGIKRKIAKSVTILIDQELLNHIDELVEKEKNRILNDKSKTKKERRRISNEINRTNICEELIKKGFNLSDDEIKKLVKIGLEEVVNKIEVAENRGDVAEKLIEKGFKVVKDFGLNIGNPGGNTPVCLYLTRDLLDKLEPHFKKYGKNRVLVDLLSKGYYAYKLGI